MNGLKINKIEYILSLRDMQFVMEGTLYNTIWYTNDNDILWGGNTINPLL